MKYERSRVIALGLTSLFFGKLGKYFARPDNRANWGHFYDIDSGIGEVNHLIDRSSQLASLRIEAVQKDDKVSLKKCDELIARTKKHSQEFGEKCAKLLGAINPPLVLKKLHDEKISAFVKKMDDARVAAFLWDAASGRKDRIVKNAQEFVAALSAEYGIATPLVTYAKESMGTVAGVYVYNTKGIELTPDEDFLSLPHYGGALLSTLVHETAHAVQASFMEREPNNIAEHMAQRYLLLGRCLNAFKDDLYGKEFFKEKLYDVSPTEKDAQYAEGVFLASELGSFALYAAAPVREMRKRFKHCVEIEFKCASGATISCPVD